MMLLRRLRGVLVTAFLWAAVWGPLGCLIAVALVLSSRAQVVGLSFGNAMLAVLAFYGLWGTVSGGVFAVALSIAERQRRIEELSMGRVALWGAVGGAALPAIGSVAIILTGHARQLPLQIAVLFAIASLLGSLCSAATLALARRGGALTVER